MAAELHQRWQLDRIHAVVDEGGVSATHRSFWRTQTNRARFEDLLVDPVEFATRDIGIAGFLGVSAFVFYFASRTSTWNFLGTSALLIAAAYAFWLARPDQRKKIQLSGGSFPVIIYRELPSREAVDRFLEHLHSCVRSHLRSNYPPAQTVHSLPGEIERLFWLKERGAISETEYQELKVRLISSSSGPGYGQYA